MEIYIKSNAHDDLGIMTFIDKIDAIIVVDDARTFRHQDIRGSEEIDYSDYSDMQLGELSIDDLQDIVDFNTLDRLAGIRPDDLTDTQINILKAEYSNHEPLSIGAVSKLLRELRECNTVNVIQSRKNRQTAAQYPQIARRVLDIIHGLQIRDYAYNTKDYSRGYLQNELAVFTTDVNTGGADDSSGQSEIIVYIKIDITQLLEDRSTIVAVSFHKADNGHEPRPYLLLDEDDIDDTATV